VITGFGITENRSPPLDFLEPCRRHPPLPDLIILLPIFLAQGFLVMPDKSFVFFGEYHFFVLEVTTIICFIIWEKALLSSSPPGPCGPSY
jgi:hypothetical protein